MQTSALVCIMFRCLKFRSPQHFFLLCVTFINGLKSTGFDYFQATGKAFVMASFVQKSTVLSNRRRCPSDIATTSNPLDEESHKLSTASSVSSLSHLTPAMSSSWLDQFLSTSPVTPPKSSTSSSSFTLTTNSR